MHQGSPHPPRRWIARCFPALRSRLVMSVTTQDGILGSLVYHQGYLCTLHLLVINLECSLHMHGGDVDAFAGRSEVQWRSTCRRFQSAGERREACRSWGTPEGRAWSDAQQAPRLHSAPPPSAPQASSRFTSRRATSTSGALCPTAKRVLVPHLDPPCTLHHSDLEVGCLSFPHSDSVFLTGMGSFWKPASFSRERLHPCVAGIDERTGNGVI